MSRRELAYRAVAATLIVLGVYWLVTGVTIASEGQVLIGTICLVAGLLMLTR